MGDGVLTIAGPAAQLPVGVVSVSEQGLATAHHQRMGEANAQRTAQVILKQKTAILIHAQVLHILSTSQTGMDWLVCDCYFHCS